MFCPSKCCRYISSLVVFFLFPRLAFSERSECTRRPPFRAVGSDFNADFLVYDCFWNYWYSEEKGTYLEESRLKFERNGEDSSEEVGESEVQDEVGGDRAHSVIEVYERRFVTVGVSSLFQQGWKWLDKTKISDFDDTQPVAKWHSYDISQWR